MRASSRSLSACIIVVMSCVVWTGAISFAAVHFLQLPATSGWMIAGFLGLVGTLAVTIILHGMRHAAILPDPPDPLLPSRSESVANRNSSPRG